MIRILTATALLSFALLSLPATAGTFGNGLDEPSFQRVDEPSLDQVTGHNPICVARDAIDLNLTELDAESTPGADFNLEL